MVPELLHTAGLGEFAWTVYLFTFAWDVVGSRPTSATATVSTVPVRARSRWTPPGFVVMASPWVAGGWQEATAGHSAPPGRTRTRWSALVRMRHAGLRGCITGTRWMRGAGRGW